MGKDVLDGELLVLTLANMLRITESKIHGFQKQKKSGQEYTIPTISNDGEVAKPQLLNELINQHEKEKVYLEKVIVWAETRRPGSSRQEDGEQLLKEYEDSHE